MTFNSAIANDDISKIMPSIYNLLMADSGEHRYVKNDGPDKNPMKGWNAGWWYEGREETSVGFQYIAWREFEPSNGVFDKSAVERIIDRAGSDGRHLILRLHCDWAGLHDPTNPQERWKGWSAGCPEWMYDEGENSVGVTHITGMHKGDKDWQGNPLAPTITDYNDPKYLEQAIAKLAEFYDDDPRVYAIELGILGYWGEWHAHGSNLDSNGGYEIDKYSNSYTVSDQSKQQVYDSYLKEFSSARLMARYPSETIFENGNEIGFHNDFFMPENGQSIDFDNAVSARNLWLQGPIGGEARQNLRAMKREPC